MKPGKLDLPTIWRGCEYLAIILDWKDQDGHAINLDGFFPYATLRDGTNLNAAIVNAATGKTKISLDHNQTAVLKLGVQDWDWLWFSPDPLVILPPFLTGKVAIKQPISHAASTGDLPIATPT